MPDLTEFLRVTIWPALAVFACVRFQDEIKALLTAVATGKLSLEAGPSGIKLTQAVESAAAAGFAAGAQVRRDGHEADDTATASQIARAVERTVISARAPRGQRILWVDDKPDDNRNLVKSFEALGIEVIEVTGTEAGIEKSNAGRFDLVVTDMGRPQDDEAGLTLIRSLREKRIDTPVIIYAAWWAGQHRGEEAKWDAKLITNRPNEVYARALEILREAGTRA